MNACCRLLLSPYRLPTGHQVLLNEEDTASWLNAYAALWHPALVLQAESPPMIDSPYDHEFPAVGCVYARPESPPLFQPDDWDDRVRDAGAAVFMAVPDRAATLDNLDHALRQTPPEQFPREELDPLLTAPAEIVSLFLGVGVGYLLIETLFDAMEHDHLLEAELFWQDVQTAARALLGQGLHDGETPEAGCRRSLTAAAERLRSAREIIYPGTIHLLHLALLNDTQPPADAPAILGTLNEPNGPVVNVIGSALALQRLGEERPEWLAGLRERVASGTAEMCGGIYRDRDDTLTPLESQLWNLRRGLSLTRELLGGSEIRVFARRRGEFHHQLPAFLQAFGLRRAILVAFDGSVIPSHYALVVNWPAGSGKPVDAFARTPLPAEKASTVFNLMHHLRESIQQDTVATLAFSHSEQPTAGPFQDLIALNRLAPVLGTWTTMSTYLDEAMAGEYASPGSPDEFFVDHLDERVQAHRPDAVGVTARWFRQRRRLDSAWTLAGLLRGLNGPNVTEAETTLAKQLHACEEEMESEGLGRIEGTHTAEEDGGAVGSATELPPPPSLPAEPIDSSPIAGLEKALAEALAARLLSRAKHQDAGCLVLNPCSVTRRLALELPGMTGPIPVEGPIKAAQFDLEAARLVVEVPPMGFAWFPQRGPDGTPAPRARLKLADGTSVRNEFFEADIDPASGGLRALKDVRTRVPRLGQQLTYHPGSVMKARDVRVTANGPALGEVMSEGAILDEQGQVLALFRQRFRAWLGRPVLDIRSEIFPRHAASGYPWHAFYGMRFAWRDERATLMRGTLGPAHTTTHPRPVSPDFIELRLGREVTTLFTGGLPFLQKQGGRMLDLVLIPEGEQTRRFEVALAVDRDHAAQTALGYVTPPVVVPVSSGPPHIGPSGWLFHLDAPNLLVTTLRPWLNEGTVEPAVVVQMLECSPYGGPAELRCVRNPTEAEFIETGDSPSTTPVVDGDAIRFEALSGDLLRLLVKFA